MFSKAGLTCVFIPRRRKDCVRGTRYQRRTQKSEIYRYTLLMLEISHGGLLLGSGPQQCRLHVYRLSTTCPSMPDNRKGHKSTKRGDFCPRFAGDDIQPFEDLLIGITVRYLEW